MYGFGAQAQWRSGRVSISYYPGVDARKDQDRLLNPAHLYCISGYIMQDFVGDRALNNLTRRKLKLIDDSISSYLSIIKSSEQIHVFNQSNYLSGVLGGIQSYRLGVKEDSNERVIEAQDHSTSKSEHNQRRQDEERLYFIHICGFLVCYFFCIQHVSRQYLKVKQIMLLCHYHFGPEKFISRD